MFRLQAKRERSLSCDGHIFFFTIDSLSRAYEKAGFALERLDVVGRSLTLDRLAYNVAVTSKIPALHGFLSSISRRLLLHKVGLTINVRDMQRLCLRKPGG